MGLGWSWYFPSFSACSHFVQARSLQRWMNQFLKGVCCKHYARMPVFHSHSAMLLKTFYKLNSSPSLSCRPIFSAFQRARQLAHWARAARDDAGHQHRDVVGLSTTVAKAVLGSRSAEGALLGRTRHGTTRNLFAGDFGD